jgi:hypothetical protein
VPAAFFWLLIYGIIGLIALIVLLRQGFGYLLLLALPGLPVFVWHLYLVSRRAERRQMGIEVVGSGVLALAAPAAFWVGVGKPEPSGWWLFILIWLQSAASIVYAYLRLEQREWTSSPNLPTRLRKGQRALLYSSFNLALVIILSLSGAFPLLLPIPYILQWVEVIWGTLKPAIGFKPTSIGVRQLIISSLFTLLFILTWKGG